MGREDPIRPEIPCNLMDRSTRQHVALASGVALDARIAKQEALVRDVIASFSHAARVVPVPDSCTRYLYLDIAPHIHKLCSLRLERLATRRCALPITGSSLPL